jgi:predicted kinase
MQELVLYVGAAGSGKTFYANDLAKTEGHIHLSSDGFRAILGTGEEDQSVSAKAFEYMRNTAEYFLRQGKNVIIDAMNLNPKSRKDFIQIGRKYKARIVAAVVNPPLEAILQRNAGRDRKVPEDIIRYQHTRLILPTEQEVDRVFIVEG